MAVTFSDGKVSNHESKSDEDENFFAFTAIAVVNESDLVEKKTLPMENSLRVLTCKKLITSYARLL